MNKQIIFGTLMHCIGAAIMVLLGLTPVGAGAVYFARELGQQKHEFPGTHLDFSSFKLFWDSAKHAVKTIGLRFEALVQVPVLVQWAVPTVVALGVYYFK